MSSRSTREIVAALHPCALATSVWEYSRRRGAGCSPALSTAARGLSTSARACDEVIHFASDRSREAACDVFLGFPFRDAPRRIGRGCRVRGEPDDGYLVQRTARGPVSALVEAVLVRFARRWGDGSGAAQAPRTQLRFGSARGCLRQRIRRACRDGRITSTTSMFCWRILCTNGTVWAPDAGRHLPHERGHAEGYQPPV